MDGDSHTGQPDSFSQALAWLLDERQYTLNKFGIEADKEHVEDFNNDKPWWENQFENYLHRAKILGLDTPVGRQALAKFVSTALGMLAATIDVYGPLPKAGVPSGEVKE